MCSEIDNLQKHLTRVEALPDLGPSSQVAVRLRDNIRQELNALHEQALEVDALLSQLAEVESMDDLGPDSLVAKGLRTDIQKLIHTPTKQQASEDVTKTRFTIQFLGQKPRP